MNLQSYLDEMGINYRATRHEDAFTAKAEFVGGDATLGPVRVLDSDDVLRRARSPQGDREPGPRRRNARIDTQRVGDKRTTVEFVGVYGLDFGNARFQEGLQCVFAYLGIAFQYHFTGFRVDDIFGQRATEQVFPRHGQFLHARRRRFSRRPGLDGR